MAFSFGRITPLQRLSSDLQTPLSGFGIEAGQISAAISQNLKNPIGSAATMRSVGRIFGSADEFMSEYQNFENLYKLALKKELSSTALSAGQREMVKAAINAPIINLNLIKDFKERTMLQGILDRDILKVEALIKNFGAPGIAMPSANLFRSAARFLVDQSGVQPRGRCASIFNPTFESNI